MVISAPAWSEMETALLNHRERALRNMDHSQLVADKPCSCNFRCHHAWVSLLSGESGLVLKNWHTNRSSRGETQAACEGVVITHTAAG